MFITREEFESLSYENLCNAFERAHNKTIEDTLRFLPDIIIGLIVKSKGIKAAYDAFEKEHPEFMERKDELVSIIESIELENGALSLDEILKKVPEKMRDLNTKIPVEQPHTITEVERTANGFI